MKVAFVTMNTDIREYNQKLAGSERDLCDALADVIDRELSDAESKIWHAHPVWFIDGNPIVGYSRLKNGIRLMFWSGASFDEEGLRPGTGKFKDASVLYRAAHEIDKESLHRWLKKAREIQWNYKNVVKRKGVLERLK